MTKKGKAGVTLLDSLKQVYKTTGKKPRQLEEYENLELNAVFDRVLELFGRVGSMPLSELKAYCDMTGERLTQLEIEAYLILTKTLNRAS